MNPATFNYVQEILETMREQDLALEQNPLNRVADKLWKEAYRALPKDIFVEGPPFWLQANSQ